MDLFLVRKNGLLSDTAHDWKHVEVVAKLKKEFDNDVEETLLQIGGYVWEVFSHQPTRRFVHGFTICGNIMEVWVFDRSGCYSPGAFDIHKEPKRFIQVIAGYAMMNEQELGLDTYVEQHGDYQLIHVEQNGSRDRKKLWLKPCAFAFQEEIVGRGTSCYLTKTSETGDWNTMTKFSWTSDKGGPESGILMLARSRGVEGVATLTDHCLLTNTKEMRSGLTFHKPYQFQSSGHPDATNEESYDNRILRRLVISPAGRTINRFRTKLELLGALRDAIKAHKSLYVKGNILHRNISDNNIIITDAKKTGFMGMLIDLSHAGDLSTGPRPSDERCPVGTVQFMAYQVLYNIDHTYRHDLESFFDVLVWLCARHGWGDRWPEDSLLIDWYTGTYRTIGLSKVACRSPSVFEELLMEFPSDFECLKPLCRELRGILFPIRGDDFFMGTPEDPETLYKPMIEAFDKAINSIKDEREEHDYQIALKPSSQ